MPKSQKSAGQYEISRKQTPWGTDASEAPPQSEETCLTTACRWDKMEPGQLRRTEERKPVNQLKFSIHRRQFSFVLLIQTTIHIVCCGENLKVIIPGYGTGEVEQSRCSVGSGVRMQRNGRSQLAARCSSSDCSGL